MTNINTVEEYISLEKYKTTTIVNHHQKAKNQMATVTVLIIGCGVAGPVLANFLKRKGYNPIVFEKVPQLGDVGASLMMMPNGYAKICSLVTLCDHTRTDFVIPF